MKFYIEDHVGRILNFKNALYNYSDNKIWVLNGTMFNKNFYIHYKDYNSTLKIARFILKTCFSQNKDDPFREEFVKKLQIRFMI